MISFITLVIYLLIVFIIMFYSVVGDQSALNAFFQSAILVTILSIIPAVLGGLIGMVYQRKRIEKEKHE